MKFSKILFRLFLASIAALGLGCQKSTSDAPSVSCSSANFTASTYSNSGSAGANANVMTVTVNGNLCGTSQYPNQPCTSVTICSPSNPSNCQTINNVLLDTGSYGLRLFSSVITVPLAPITNGSSTLAECVQYGDGTSQWGPVQYAYVKLGNEPAVAMPIHTVDFSYGSPPGPCTSSQSSPDLSPAMAGYNGIIGVGLFKQDCGSYCVSHTDAETYYTCTSGNCSCGATVAIDAQVQNPVAMLPSDNNGVMLSIPAVGTLGVANTTGTLFLGIGTSTNNNPSGTTTYETTDSGFIASRFTPFSNSLMLAFIDSGSNALYFPAPTSGVLTDCGGVLTSFFCPTNSQDFTATLNDIYGTVGTVGFQIANTQSLLSGSNAVFSNLGGNSYNISLGPSSALFDWGLPFFFGKNVFVGFENSSSTLGSGPLWAF